MLRKRKHLTAYENGQIIAAFQAGKKVKLIARDLNIPEQTIYTKRRIFLQRGHLKPAPKSGRPKKSTDRDRRLICRLSQKDPFKSAVKIANEIPHLHLSPTTIRRVLFNTGGLKCRRAAKKPFLREINRLARLLWAREHKDWTIDQWKEVIWSDESKYCIRNHASRKVYRPDGKRYHHKYTQKTVKHDKSVMVWGCFSHAGIGRLHRINGIMNGMKYRTILSQNLYLSAQDLFGASPWIFQHDNDPKHTCQLIKGYLRYKRTVILPWPSQSPDLNPIEHLWSKLESDLQRRDCNTPDQLFEVLKQGWESIDSKYMKDLVESMPRRCRAVIKAKGHMTKY